MSGLFGKKDEANFDRVDTLIGKDTVFEGSINAKGTLRVDGKITGQVNCQGDVVIGESGVVEADLRARHILVAGTINGNVIAQAKVELASTGTVRGDINVASLIIDDGAVFEGNCTMKSNEKAGHVKENNIEK